MTRVMLLASGGLDSTTLAYKLVSRGTIVYPLFLDYGQHCAEKEWKTCQEVLQGRTLKPEKVLIADIYRGSSSRLIVEPDIWQDSVYDEDLYLPYRSLLFFSTAAARAQTMGITDVYSAFINTDHVQEIDCATEYLNNLLSLTADVGCVRFNLPFRNLTKSQVAKLAIDLSVPIGKTYSCQLYSTFPCGTCPNCVDRLEALDEVGFS